MQLAEFFDRVEGRLDTSLLPTSVHLIRHAEPLDRADRPTESFLDPELSARGHSQATRLAAKWGADELPARIVCSSFRRTVATAEPLAQRCGVVLVDEPELREVELLSPQWPSDADRTLELNRFAMTGKWEDLPGFESSVSLRARARRVVLEAIRDERGGSVALFTHGAFINAFVAEVVGTPVDFFFAVPYASVTTVMTDGERWVLTKLGGNPPDGGLA